MSCGQVRGQCVEFSKKAKRNNGVCALRDLRAAVIGLPCLLSAVFRQARFRAMRWNDRGKQVRGYFTDFDAQGNLDDGCRTVGKGKVKNVARHSRRANRYSYTIFTIMMESAWRPGALI
jgi:hypothetical protein